MLYDDLKISAGLAMATKAIGIIVNGATGRICSTQHLQNALAPIRDEGGLCVGDDRIVPRLLLVGRDPARLAPLVKRYGAEGWSADLDVALSDPGYSIFFDAAATHQRLSVLHKAVAAGKHIYAEKPVVPTVAEGMALLREIERRGLKHGAVEDKLSLPGLHKLSHAIRTGFVGRIVGFRLEFGWWVFDGVDTTCQRPSWNYRRAGGGGLVLDMFSHWRYVIEGALGNIRRLCCAAWTATPERVDEAGNRYTVDVDDSAATLVELESGAIGTVLSSWATRVRRDDLLVLQVDGTNGSAVAGLHKCHLQSATATPKTQWNATTDIGADYSRGWGVAPDVQPYQNGYRAGWEAFLRHVAAGTPMRADLVAGIRDVEFAEACYRSAREGRWVSMAATAG